MSIDLAELGDKARRGIFVALTRDRLQVALVTGRRAEAALRQALNA